MQTRKRLLSFVLSGSLSLLLGAGVLPSQAWAGFQWVPSDQTTTTTAPTTSSTGSSSVTTKTTTPSSTYTTRQPEMPAPLVIEGTAPVRNLAEDTAAMSAEEPVSVTLPTAQTELAPAASISTSTSKTPHSLGSLTEAAPTPVAPVPAGEKIVRGFANSVPLSVALRQILPSDRGFSIAPDVSENTLVSWQGGAPWRQTAQDMLGKAGLSMEENGTVIKIVHGGLGGASAEAPLLEAPPATNASKPAASSAAFLEATPVEAPRSAPVLQPIAEGKPIPLAPGAINDKPASPTSSSPPPASGQFLTPPPGVISDVGAPPAPSLVATAQGAPVHDISNGQLSTIDTWSAARGESLRKIIETWCTRANIELSWLAEYDYPLQASAEFNGTFEEAVRGLLSGLQDAKPQPIGTLHASQTSGQAILVIQSRGNNYND